MLPRRFLSNLIDSSIFWLIYLFCFWTSGLENNESNSNTFLFLSFLIVIILPVSVVNNTFGKVVLGMKWAFSDTLKQKLLAKYLLYFLAVSPALSLSSALTTLIAGNERKTMGVVFTQGTIGAAFIFVDLIVYLFSWGKFHLTDYFLKLKIEGRPYHRTGWKILGMIYLFVATVIGIDAVLIRQNFLPHRLEDHFKRIFFEEQFPIDQVFGQPVLISKEYNDHVFTPSEPMTFLYAQKKDQEIIYIPLPWEIFQSLQARQKVCYNTLSQALINNSFSFYHPKQIKFVLFSYKKGRFLNYYIYHYVYYFEIDRPFWGIYGGIKTDSSTVHQYEDFLIKYQKEKIPLIELKFKARINQIVKKANTDSVFRKKLIDAMSEHFYFISTINDITIKLDSAHIDFKKIDFKDSHLYGTVQINFPTTEIVFQLNNIFSDQLMDLDENIQQLLLVRKITNDNLDQ